MQGTLNHDNPPRTATDRPESENATSRQRLADKLVVSSKKSIDKQSPEYIIKSGVAGGLAGCAAKTVVAPLDRVKILFQANNPHFLKYSGSWTGTAIAIRDIYQQDGTIGLFRGHSATLIRIFPYAGIKFLAYEQIRTLVIPTKEHETPVRRLVSGALAGVTSVFFVYPLDVIRVRLAYETKHDRSKSALRSICKQIYHEQQGGRLAVAVAEIVAHSQGTRSADMLRAVTPGASLVNFYRGFLPTVLGMLPYAGMSFLTHDTVGDLLRHPLIADKTTLPRPAHIPEGRATPLRSWAELLAGGVAGLVSQTVSYPLEVIRRRMQVGGAVGDGHRLRIGETMRLIMKERGVRGFFVGLTIGYVKIVPMAAASFYAYERFKTWFGI